MVMGDMCFRGGSSGKDSLRKWLQDEKGLAGIDLGGRACTKGEVLNAGLLRPVGKEADVVGGERT